MSSFDCRMRLDTSQGLCLPALYLRKTNFSKTEPYCVVVGACGGAVGWGTALQAGRSWVQFMKVSFEFYIDIILPAALYPWGRLSLQQKLIFLGHKDCQCVWLNTLPPSCATCLEIWEPQTPGNLWACNGPLQVFFYLYCVVVTSYSAVGQEWHYYVHCQKCSYWLGTKDFALECSHLLYTKIITGWCRWVNGVMD